MADAKPHDIHQESSAIIRLHGWSIELDRIIVSSVGVGLVVTPEETRGQNIDDLGDILALVKEIALESDLLMPLVVAVKGLRNGKEAYEICRRLQEFHRGKFLLLPEAGDGALSLLRTLLNREPVDISSFEPPTPMDLHGFWEKMEQNERLNNYFAPRLSRWKNVDSPITLSPEHVQKYWQEKWKKMLSGANPGSDERKDGHGQDMVGGQPDEQERPEAFCTRIVAARIRNFKGLKACPDNKSESPTLNLDADIILVTGANGNGKSSFVEALSLALTGYHPAWETGGLKESFFYANENRLEIQLTLKEQSLLDDVQKKRTLTLRRNKDGSRPDQQEDHLSILRRETGTEESGKGGKEIFVPLNKQLHYRMTTYLPEYVDMLFDENVDPPLEAEDAEQDPEISRCMGATREINTIRHLFPALSPEIEALCKAAEDRLREVDDKLQREISKIENLENYSGLYEEAKGFVANLQDLIRKLPVDNAENWQPDPRWDDMPENVPAFVSLLDDEKKSLEGLFSDSLASWPNLGAMIDQYRKTRIGSRNVQTEISDLEQEIEALSRKVWELTGKIQNPEIRSKRVSTLQEFYRFLIDEKKELVKELSDWSNWFEDGTGKEREKPIQGSVAESSPAKGHETSVRVQDLAQEIEMLNTDQLEQAKDILDDLLGKEQDKLQRELEEAKRSLARKQQELTWYRRKESDTEGFEELLGFLEDKERHELLVRLNKFESEGNEKKYNALLKERKNLQAEKDELEELGSFILEQRELTAGGDLSLRSALENTLSNVLKRFALSEGVEKISVTEQFQIRADADQDKDHQRSVQCLSSGQKAQLAMAWMIACRELIQSEKNRDYVHFPHRILIMDDPSTTFDTTNLLSQAILWRQLAYNSEPTHRYQVFIVSHHEEFSSHLLDLLCPPPGHSMRLLKFVDWNRQEGARLKLYDVEPSPLPLMVDEVDGEAAKDQAAKALKSALKTLRNMI